MMIQNTDCVQSFSGVPIPFIAKGKKNYGRTVEAQERETVKTIEKHSKVHRRATHRLRGNPEKQTLWMNDN
jgi:hypothetical protein